MSDNKQMAISEIATGLVKLITTDNYDIAYMASSIIAEVVTINNQLAMEVINQLIPLLKDESSNTRQSAASAIGNIVEENPAEMNDILFKEVLDELKILIDRSIIDKDKYIIMAATSAIEAMIKRRLVCE